MPSLGDLRRRWEDALGAFERVPCRDAALRPAAVALAFVGGPNDVPAFLLTRRPVKLADHPGQFALPGGKRQPGEASTDAALRELSEELGVEARPVDVVGCLDDFPTRSGFAMTPVVVWLADRDVKLRPDPGEVARVYQVPFSALAATPVYVADADGGPDILRMPLLDSWVHAPTGAILHQCGELLIHGRVTRVAHVGQPRFARR